ncbi:MULTISPECIES: 3'-5' exonuclease [Carnobacterium]|uniref:DNA polymerase III polC-type n=1 Tax=Carnobacterium divergens TaxID=2748 RepID=A0A2R8A385_CARDV|nr:MULTISPECIES: 3'-5' exonuclease [Carnobacterium]AOA00760.1 exonuclease [Carnobacterium divergens]MCO6016861.1 3'-5' exonuclease [Carnobacterium divergens]MDT1940582.1 3'-5' exonuclease [Carnobacterium divergens]MDT1943020.1 3'-5' exonuclease [Carnobacterium divergens]MDT1948827.1 3'-5' exonuclease [Carnobacterium divergens]
MNFVALDFETANHERHSACSVALTVVRNSQIVDNYYTLIKPETPFFWRNVQVHGIHERDVANAPNFAKVWDDMKPCFKENKLIVAHNLPFDQGVLNGCLDYYEIERPHFQTLCTVQSSRRLLTELPNHKLNTVCDHFGINLENHHHALDDSNACATILLHLENNFGTEPLKKLVKHV